MAAVSRVLLFLSLLLLSISLLAAAAPHTHGSSYRTFRSPLPVVTSNSSDVTKTVLQWSRQLRTCDSEADMEVELTGTSRVIYALGDQQPLSDEKVGIHSTMGVKNVNLMSTPFTPDIPSDVIHTPFMTRPFPIDANTSSLDSPGTYYHCQGFKQTWTQKQHVVKVTPQVDFYHSALVHHMILFTCDTPLDQTDLDWAGNCYADDTPKGISACDQISVVMGWAVGGGEFYFPEDVGFPIGGNGPTYLMIQVHYHNPNGMTFNDSAGFVLTSTPTLRKYDAGAFALHHDLDSLAIPPQQSAFNLSVYTPSECLVDLPPTGLNVFASMLHTHITGVSVQTQHFRGGVEQPFLDQNKYYDFNFQQVVPLGRGTSFPRLMSGDQLKLTCTYNTMSRQRVTLGGIATTDEMCIDYLWYWPADYSKRNTLAIAVGSRQYAQQDHFTTFCMFSSGEYHAAVDFAQPPIVSPLPSLPCTVAAGGGRIWGTPDAKDGTTGTVAISAAQWAEDKKGYTQSTVLDDAGKITLFWNVSVDTDGGNGVISFAAEAETSGWVGVGLSGAGAMVDSDSVIGWVKTAEEGAASTVVDLTDRFNREYRQPPIDKSQDVWNVRGVQTLLPPTPPPVNPIYYNTTAQPAPLGMKSVQEPKGTGAPKGKYGLAALIAKLLSGTD